MTLYGFLGRYGNHVRERRKVTIAWIAPSPETEVGIFARMIRFALAGGLVASVYVLVTLVLARVAGLPFQLALVLGYGTALTTHFALQRFFVWVHRTDFALSLGTQAGRYLTLAVAQYVVTAASTATLPDALHVATEIVYLAVTALTTVINFLLFRTHVFHPEQVDMRTACHGDRRR